MFYGPLDKCPVCGGQLECKGLKYNCTGTHSEWACCSFSTNNPSRRGGPIKVPDDVKNDFVRKVTKLHFEYLFAIFAACLGLLYISCILFLLLQWLKQQEGNKYPKRNLDDEGIFSGMMIALSGRMSRSHVIPLNIASNSLYVNGFQESNSVGTKMDRVISRSRL
jgi:poly [ADP-ribose] polymerase